MLFPQQELISSLPYIQDDVVNKYRLFGPRKRKLKGAFNDEASITNSNIIH